MGIFGLSLRIVHGEYYDWTRYEKVIDAERAACLSPLYDWVEVPLSWNQETGPCFSGVLVTSRGLRPDGALIVNLKEVHFAREDMELTDRALMSGGWYLAQVSKPFAGKDAVLSAAPPAAGGGTPRTPEGPA